MFQATPIVIKLNIYDLHNSNSVLYNVGMGFFHTGVEVNGYEFSFSANGVLRTRPQLPEFGVLREQIVMGTYTGGMQGIYNIISTLRNARFMPGAYHPTDLNCNHFSEAFCVSAVNAHIPDWVNRMAGIGSTLSRPTASSSNVSTPSSAGQLPAPGVVKDPSLTGPISTANSTPSATAATEQSGEGSLVSSIFNWLGWGDAIAADASNPDSSSANNHSNVNINNSNRTTPSTSKKELTDKQKQLLMKMKHADS